MNTGVLLLSMAACGLVTFLLRLSFIAFGQHLPNDPRFTAALRYVPPAILGALLKELVRGSDDDWDKEKILKKLAKEQLNYLMGTMVLTREIGAAITSDYGYSGPAGVRLFAEVNKLAKQAEQGEIDKALVKSAINVAGVAGIPVIGQFPAGQVNRTIDGIVAVSEGTAGPQAVIFGAPLKH